MSLLFTLLEETCVNVSVYSTPGRVFSHATARPLALSFLQTNYDLARSNTFAVVTNGKDVTVGQIQSSMVRVEVQNLTGSDTMHLKMSLCMLFDPTMGVRGIYDVFDLGILVNVDTIRPMGTEAIKNVTTFGELTICFTNVTLLNLSTSFILIERASDFENLNAYTSGERDIVLTSGSLFCFGVCVVLVFHCLWSLLFPVIVLGAESVCLLLFRGVYFLLLGTGSIPIGGLLDFSLIEIPTFIFVGLFLQIILVAYRFFFNHSLSKKMLALLIGVSLTVNWMIFAALMIAIDLSDTPPVTEKTCDCQITLSVQQSDAAQIIRIVYKSFVLIIAFCVLTITFVFRTEVAKAGGLQGLYTQVAVLSLALLLDCVAFVVYYAVNIPSAYFVIVLWFTELLPICMMNGVLTWTTRKIS